MASKKNPPNIIDISKIAATIGVFESPEEKTYIVLGDSKVILTCDQLETLHTKIDEHLSTDEDDEDFEDEDESDEEDEEEEEEEDEE